MDLSKEEELVMKMVHYFITKNNYNPVVLHGAKNEIWLENLEKDFKIIRLVSNYIHNDEQLNYDLVKTNHISKTIKKKTLSRKIPVLSIFVNLGDNVKVTNYENITCLHVKKIADLSKNKDFLTIFPDVLSSFNFNEKGPDLFVKLTNEINSKAKKDSVKTEAIFKQKIPYVTYSLILINVIMFLLLELFADGNFISGFSSASLIEFGASRRFEFLNLNEYFRVITGTFLHNGIIHLLFNIYALYILGAQVENFYGKIKFLIIYFISALSGSFMSMLFFEGVSVGASGAIFGLLGALIYFGYHYRLYLGTALRSQLIPILILNLIIGFLTPGIDNGAHIGGLVGGILASVACGVALKAKKASVINGIILLAIFLSSLLIILFTL